MGQITEALRRHLRDIAHSDARSLRAIGEAIPSEPCVDQPRAETQDESDRPSTVDLHRLSKAELYSMCKQAGLRGLSKARKDELIEALLNTGSSPCTSPLSVTARLERLEKILLLIAQEVGIPQEQLQQIFNS